MQNYRQVKVESLAMCLPDGGYEERWQLSSNNAQLIPPRMQNKDIWIRLRTQPIGAR